jgi:hypothetical protein
MESVNMNSRNSIGNRGWFPTDKAALILIYLTLQIISEKWTMPIREWMTALNRFAIVWAKGCRMFNQTVYKIFCIRFIEQTFCAYYNSRATLKI